MDRGTWWAIVHGVAESDMTEGLTFLHFLNTFLENVFSPIFTYAL